MPSFLGLGRFFGNTASSAAGFAAGAATSRTLDPLLQNVSNKAWTENPVVPPDVYALAEGVAQGQVAKGWAYDRALEQGFDKTRMDALVSIANTGPPLGSALQVLRRNIWTPDQYKTALNRQGIEPQWYDGLLALEQDLLSPQVLALAIVRGLIPDPGILPVGPPTATGNIPAFPVFNVDAVKEAAGAGIDLERLSVLVGINGRPMSPQEAAHGTFRGILVQADFERAIAEGDVRNEWAAAILEVSRQIPTAHEWIEARLRGWIDDAAMYAGTGHHGMTAADTDILFKVSGRPLSFHQVFIGTRRGGKYDGPVSDLDPAFLKSLQESNIRPEWYNLAWAQRYNYPSAFVLKSLTTGGDITADEAEQVLLYEGWEPTFAKKVSAAWGASVTKPTKPKKLTNATIRSAWKKGNLTREQALTDLEANGLSAADAVVYLES